MHTLFQPLIDSGCHIHTDMHIQIQDQGMQCDGTYCMIIQFQEGKKRFKTGPFELAVGQTGTSLCPVAALLIYLWQRGLGESPFISLPGQRGHALLDC